MYKRQEQFEAKLAAQGFEFYTRGKNFGVKVTEEGKDEAKYRFSTLGIHETYEEFASVMQGLSEAQDVPEQEYEPEPAKEEAKQSEGQSHAADDALRSDDVIGEKEKEGRGSEEPKAASQKSDFQQDMENIYAKKREKKAREKSKKLERCLLYTSPSPRD